MRYFSSLLAFALALLIAGYSLAQPTEMAKPLPADVRVLIDVSGSMKKTDPQNLRKPAMELLVQLLPENSKAGIWTFGQSVNLLVAHRPVDKEWYRDATAKASGINSVALYTNIGKALEQATYDRQQLKADYRHNIILLTDGVVDISPDSSINSKERQRILTELLPAIKSAGYIVHTIALSADADQELMEQLSLATDGIFAVADTAEELMSSFLRIFDQAVPAERLPLEDNRFLVDESVEEFTALIFRKQGAAPTVLVSPAGVSYSEAKLEDRVNWFKTDRYDLITVEKPAAGEWQLKADFDPDSRVTVVSDLQLQMSSLNNNIQVSQPLDMHFSFQEESATVTSMEFLRLLDINARISRSSDSKNWLVPLSESNPPIDGIYHQSLDVFKEKGSYAIRVLIDGKTFKREYKHNLTVISPFTFDMHKSIVEEKVSYLFSVTYDKQLIDQANTSVLASIKNSQGSSEVRELTFTENLWQLVVTPTTQANYSVTLEVKGKRIDGSSFAESLGTRYFTYPEKDDPLMALPTEPEPIEQAVETLPVVDEPVALEVPVEDKMPEPVLPPKEEMNQWLLYAGISLANLLVFGLAFVAYRMIVGKKAKDELAELEATLETEIPVGAAQPKGKPPMQEVENKKMNTIDVSQENLQAHIDISDDQPSTLSDDALLLDFGDLDADDKLPDKDK